MIIDQYQKYRSSEKHMQFSDNIIAVCHKHFPGPVYEKWWNKYFISIKKRMSFFVVIIVRDEPVQYVYAL